MEGERFRRAVAARLPASRACRVMKVPRSRRAGYQRGRGRCSQASWSCSRSRCPRRPATCASAHSVATSPPTLKEIGSGARLSGSISTSSRERTPSPPTLTAAPTAGPIVVARGLYFSGNTVVIDHGLGLFSTLAHLSEIDVHEGDRVPAGQIIGRVGATGRVTGPHLHWAVRASGARVDPLSLLALLGT